MGTGEKLDMIEPFHPDRMAQRILGMGDVLSFIERAEQSIDEEKAKKLEEKLKRTASLSPTITTSSSSSRAWAALNSSRA